MSFMMLGRLGIIGIGGIAEVVITTIASRLGSPLEHVSVLVLPELKQRALTLLDGAGSKLAKIRSAHTSIDAVLADKPQLIAECASHSAVREYGVLILSAGIDLLVVSIGALADDHLRTEMEKAASGGGSRIVLPSGAIGAIDALGAARLSGLELVVYTGRKPPKAWLGTAAARFVELNTLREPAIFYEGDARTAALEFPMNANVTATLALAGIGFDRTSVRLVADPTITQNIHEFAVRAACGDFTIRLEGRPSSANPKSSLLAGYSVARELLNRISPVVI